MKLTQNRENFIEEVKPLLKKHGFKKIKHSWFKEKSVFVYVFNIQASQFSEVFYINVAIGFLKLLSTGTPPEYKCQIRSRINHNDDPERTVNEAINWFLKYGSIEKLKEQLDKNTLPPATTIEAKEYLKNLSNVT